MIMSSPVKERALIDIRATVESHSDVADDLLAIHVLSGADAVASLHGIGKATVIKVFKCIHGMLPSYLSDCITMYNEIAVKLGILGHPLLLTW